ncbi:hydroxyisourate hydrolase [Aeribacillus sp. FSL K6-2848]|jgi:5-hydroxyisourate hydrolase|uniref:5-hydroxyisourate hydrolase n=1 Tax=Aeribacillus pallidus TaxID=33936 RepID=A0A223E6Q9_9BACI|nr:MULTISPECIES: hydroxyisourate hydrolase [Aeribacillus]REJ26740.1 MAG: hydroxyisourate hydrolase [Bacillaceae bacterium]ASS90880.1 hydroxyisourate hydrolase [Aeribacillus pallidus]MDR9792479.1 hydroxyisourate hydrolase [Aeribacillus pallidus]MDR9796059.1 hydroxyisourate hydrolase [Aeribacillus pallidus]MED0715622.1 hydroxyisourate hydrolase [Aeribacillus composti]
MKGLTTHILDLTHGTPAQNVKIELFSVTDQNETEKQLLKTAFTNENGRVDEPLITEQQLTPGTYELLFYIGDYFKNKGLSLKEPLFLNHVVVRFGISDANAHYHVPLLISPWGYQVYRGS